MLDSSKIYYGLDDVSILPSEIVDIKSRSECCPYVKDICRRGEDFLPIIVAPMDSIIDDTSYELYLKNRVNPIIPRTVPLSTRLSLCKKVFCAFSLKEIEGRFIEDSVDGDDLYVLIDIANGSLMSQIELGGKLKDKYGKKLVLGGGNLSNPETYRYYNGIFDWIRIGISFGGSCLTGTQTGCFVPMASLIAETYKVKTDCMGTTKIVADGGISTYSKAIKCLALGADYVMMGRVFAGCIEAAGDIYKFGLGGKKIINKNILTVNDLKNTEYFRDYYGMSSKLAQIKMAGYSSIEEAKNHGVHLKTSEGKFLRVPVQYTMSGWLENFTDYLRSAMSYTNSRFLNGEFKRKARVIVISQSSSESINNK